MRGRKTNHSSLVETIPVRNNAESVTLKDASVLTVYSRDKNTNDGSKLEVDNSANFADVIYHFPFPPKELGVIVNPVL